MEKDEPKVIKSYYITYFDILGYQDFFSNNPEKVHDFLNMIHTGIQGTINKIASANQSVLANEVASMNIEVRVFSDNVLLCLEEKGSAFERIRLLSFMMMIAEIQRGFIIQCKLFVRGGITKGKLSINNNYVFGKGLIKAVTIEKCTVYPRIEIESDLVNMINKPLSYTQEEYKRAEIIEKRIAKGEGTSDEDLKLYTRTKTAFQAEYMFNRIASALIGTWPDGKFFLSYLYCFDINSYIPSETKQMLLEFVKSNFPSDVKYLSAEQIDIEGLLKQHKERVEEQLKKYGLNADIETGNIQKAEEREHILKKYIWVMAYHNYICDAYQKSYLKIFARCNCDRRFFKITVEVFEEDDEKNRK